MQVAHILIILVSLTKTWWNVQTTNSALVSVRWANVDKFLPEKGLKIPNNYSILKP